MRDAPKLGRGLAVLLGQESLAATPAESRLHHLPVAQLGPGPHQPRAGIDPASLSELSASIARQGVLQPILVREAASGPARYQIIAGERRWRAAMAAGLETVPCIIRGLSDPDASMAALVENLQREDLNALEEAEGFQRVLERFSLTQEALAQAVGKSRSHVANTLRLLNLPASVRQDLRAGRLSAGHARALLTHPDPETAARIVLARGLNVRQTEALAGAAPAAAAPSQPVRDPDMAALERQLSEKLGLSVSIADRGGAGRVVIGYRTLDQLDGLIAVLNAALG